MHTQDTTDKDLINIFDTKVHAVESLEQKDPY